MKNFKSFMEAGFGKHQGKVDKKAVMKKYKENEEIMLIQKIILC